MTIAARPNDRNRETTRCAQVSSPRLRALMLMDCFNVCRTWYFPNQCFPNLKISPVEMRKPL